ncbi:MAG: type II toxin-antitoxin system Phd/YefM family antitoxin [bacterium]|nr:type II toxin-antitoxin system Phd/YefM family antitoxin [bacterium]
MKSKRTISVTEARKRIFEIIEDVQKPDTYYTLTEKGRPKAVVLSYEQFDDLLDDLDIYSDPDLQKAIEDAEKEIARGDTISWDELKKELGWESRELVMRDKGKGQYQVKKKLLVSVPKKTLRKRSS